MSSKAGNRAMMQGLLQEQKRLERQLEEHTEKVTLWEARFEKAHQANRQDLVALAQEQLEEALRDQRDTQLAIDAIKQEKSVLRAEHLRPEDRGEAERAEAIAENFKGLGVDPDEVALEAEFKESSVDDALAALKAKMDKS